MTIAVLSILALVALVFVLGLLLPKQREFVKTANLKNPPEEVFQIIAGFKKQASWRSDVQEIKVIDQHIWTEVPKNGTSITFRIKRKVKNQLFEIEIIEPKSFNGYWVGTFERIPTGTKIVFREVVIIENPFFRVISSIFIDLDKTMELYMANLKTKLGE